MTAVEREWRPKVTRTQAIKWARQTIKEERAITAGMGDCVSKRRRLLFTMRLEALLAAALGEEG